MYKLKKIVGRNDFSDQLRKRIGYNMNVMWKTACLVVNQITVNNFADLFNNTPVGRASDLMIAPEHSFQLSWLGLDYLSFVGPIEVQLLDFCCRSVSEFVCCWVQILVLWWILVYMFDVLIHWWVEVLHADRTSMCIWTTAEPRVRLLQPKTGFNPTQVIYYWPFQGDASVLVYSNCQCSSAFYLPLTHCSIYLG